MDGVLDDKSSLVTAVETVRLGNAILDVRKGNTTVLLALGVMRGNGLAGASEDGRRGSLPSMNGLGKNRLKGVNRNSLLLLGLNHDSGGGRKSVEVLVRVL
jgi:hypothetical protein